MSVELRLAEGHLGPKHLFDSLDFHAAYFSVLKGQSIVGTTKLGEHKGVWFFFELHQHTTFFEHPYQLLETFGQGSTVDVLCILLAQASADTL
jgi:hypothetical protein